MSTHIGVDFTPPDIAGKVTGEIKYAEDYKREGMVFARLLTSPLPAGRVVNIDASEALRMDGVVGVFTADDLPPVPPPGNPALASEYVTYVGQPILAVAAITEEIAESAIDKIRVDFERRDFVVDPIESLTPGGSNAYPEGNVLVRTREEGPEGAPIVGAEIKDIKWPQSAIDAIKTGKEPVGGEFTTEWAFGDVDAGFADAAAIIEEPFVTIGYPHHSLEARTGMAYWENGKCYFHGSSQSQSANNAGLARMLNIDLADLVFINEATGGGFGSKIGPYPFMAITGNFSKVLNRPVQLRITREQEFYIGSARSGMQGWIKIGVKENGKVSAVDLVIVNDGGATGGGSGNSSAQHVTVAYQPESMRYRGISVYTNTTPRGAQRGPGQNEMAAVLAPMTDKVARAIDMDRVAFRRTNVLDSDGFQGGSQGPVTSAFVREALDQGMRTFGWQDKIAQPKDMGNNKVRGVGVGIGYHGAGGRGYDGLLRIGTDGRLYIHSGVGNLGTYSYAGTCRAAAEALQVPWDKCDILHGRSDRHLPHSSGQGGSNTIFTHTRTNWVAAQDAITKLKEIAATDLGGSADDYEIGDERVFLSSNPSQGITYAQAAQRAIELGGKYSGQEYPDDINPLTQLAVQGIAGSGLVGVAKDNIPGQGQPPGVLVGFMEIEMDKDTGKYEILDYTAIADCGTVVHPTNFNNAMRGGAVWGVGLAGLERHVYDPQNGLPANTGLYQSKPPTNMDVPIDTQMGAVNIPDPQNPTGGRGIGEPTQGASAAALASAISDALDGHTFNTAPTTTDMIINHLAGNTYSTKSLKTNTF
ncbi:MAG: xanthine dehydrogenase family protein molybdopterin-binding subunit [Gammaproteobacteria bacterium]|jgi:CO/xanthine dehydrogenase Mo-binding subunit|nr:xanthine dehydrogenase family protein molybdopterin-binding subunit [Gammaproteobacteria bacterium]MBT3859776.1 xanthine dehydrogenase family protein molybdopterin-binding subunit [Gammaproteobacteria bacterium]MBT3988829.1 xanthine dehydrogenase family protein molybdopterin-binding subunit [Gammaproteobacteria bacterium]MBT4257383.1 xanthine dehydrogenase family protein molybdopterin-binding subunit [Gammaproteobacteria bacterium]MBT4660258.1 xanthine dehydrogenase family protein molybdopte